MGKKKRNEDGRIRGQWVPMRYEVVDSPAFRQMSFGAQVLYMRLKIRFNKNNGHVYLSLRDAAEELGHKNRNDIANWFRELIHYGFIVETEGASLGVDGKGKSPHYRLTELPTRGAHGGLDAPTDDFLKWDGTVFEPHVAPSRRWNARKQSALKKQNPGLHVRTTVDSTFVPQVDSTSVPPDDESGTDVESISLH
jgi:hypothetical protein